MAREAKTLVHRIGLEEAQKGRKQLIFVDARSTTAVTRNPRQVPGAIHVSVKDLNEAAKRLPKGRALVTYCT